MTKISILNKVTCFLFLAGNLVSCMSSAIMQTAKPLDKKEVQVSAGVGVVGANYTDEDSFVGAPVTILSHVYGKIGLGSQMDLGLRTSLAVFTHVDLDWKYNFYHSANNRFYASTGLMFSTGVFYNTEEAIERFIYPYI